MHSGMLQEPLPGWLEQLTNKIGSLKVFGSDKDIVMPNHVLINEYLPGQGQFCCNSSYDLLFYLQSLPYYPNVPLSRYSTQLSQPSTFWLLFWLLTPFQFLYFNHSSYFDRQPAPICSSCSCSCSLYITVISSTHFLWTIPGILPHEDGPLYSPTIATLNLGSHTILNFYTSVSQIDTNHSFSQSEANGDYELSQEITKQGESLRKEARSKPFCSLFLERNSLVIISGTLYKALHGIDEGMPYDIVPSSFSETASPGSNISNLNFCGVQPPLDTPLKRSTRVSLTIRHVLKTKRIKGLSFLKPPR